MSKRRILTVLLTASAVWLPAALRADDGETVRPVFSAYTLEAGSAHIADTYLTPLKYNGQHFGIDYQRWQAMKFDPQRWVMQARHAPYAQSYRESGRKRHNVGRDA